MKWFQSIFILLVSFSIAVCGDLDSQPVGPGIIHHHEYLTIGPWHVQILEIDLKNEWVILETVKAGNLLIGNEQTSSMSARSDREEHRVVGAVNGDFYASGGLPIGAQISNGILLKRPYPRSAFGFSADSRPSIDIFSFAGSLLTKSNEIISINGINEDRQTDYLVGYNSYFGSSTGTNYWGTEISASYVSQQHFINDTVQIVVNAKDSVLATGHGNNLIPSNEIVLSGHGSASTFLNNQVFVGDTLALVLKLNPSQNPLKEMIGGMPRIIRDGQSSVEWQQENIRESFCTDRHPRTALGFTADSSKLFMFTVDGRKAGYSVGMSLYELADYMLSWKVFHGINLDGGGSTTMVVRGNLANQPADAAGERAVSNALMVVSTAPTSEMAHLLITPKKPYLLEGSQIQFEVEPLDKYFNPNPTNSNGDYSWTCDSALGSFSGDGLFTTADDTASGYIFVQSANIVDSMWIQITELARLNLNPDPVILKVNESQQMMAEAWDNLNHPIVLDAEALEWTFTGLAGHISASGLFTATTEGSGWITVLYNNIKDSVEVTVGSATSLIFDSFDTVDAYALSGSLVEISACSLSTDNAFFISEDFSAKLDYQLQTGGTSALYMNCSLPVSVSPQSTGIYIYGDGKGHWLRGEFEDTDNEKFLVNFTKDNPGIDWKDSWQYKEVLFSEAIPHWANGSAVLDFPITWKKIYLVETDDSKKDNGTIYLDNFSMNYLGTGLDDQIENIVPENFALLPNFPNPFNPFTAISYQLHAISQVKLLVYNALGQKVQTLVDRRQQSGKHSVQFDGSELASGVYYYKLFAGSFTQIRKMLLLK